MRLSASDNNAARGYSTASHAPPASRPHLRMPRGTCRSAHEGARAYRGICRGTDSAVVPFPSRRFRHIPPATPPLSLLSLLPLLSLSTFALLSPLRLSPSPISTTYFTRGGHTRRGGGALALAPALALALAPTQAPTQAQAVVLTQVQPLRESAAPRRCLGDLVLRFAYLLTDPLMLRPMNLLTGLHHT